MPAPVRWRSSDTSFALKPIAFDRWFVETPPGCPGGVWSLVGAGALRAPNRLNSTHFYMKRVGPRPHAAHSARLGPRPAKVSLGGAAYSARIDRLLGFLCLGAFSPGLAFTALASRLEAGRDGFRLGATTAWPATTLAIRLAFRFGATVAAVRVALLLLDLFAHRCLTPSLVDRVGHRLRDQLHRANRVVIAGDRYGDQIGIGVRVDHGHDRNVELVRLADGDALLLGIDHEQESGESRHLLDAAEILPELLTLAREHELLLLGVVLELAA